MKNYLYHKRLFDLKLEKINSIENMIMIRKNCTKTGENILGNGLSTYPHISNEIDIQALQKKLDICKRKNTWNKSLDNQDANKLKV